MTDIADSLFAQTTALKIAMKLLLQIVAEKSETPSSVYEEFDKLLEAQQTKYFFPNPELLKEYTPSGSDPNEIRQILVEIASEIGSLRK